MQARKIEIRLLGCLVCAVLSLFMCVVAGSSSGQDQSKQQQRPRKVGANPAPSPQPSQPQTDKSSEEVDEGDVVRVETQLVTVPAVVTDRTGHPLAGLRAENFIVLEDGKPQRLTNFATPKLLLRSPYYWTLPDRHAKSWV